MSSKKTRLGKNPFEKQSPTQVGRMIEANFNTPATEPTQKVQNPSLLGRLQDMKVSFDLKELLRSVRDRNI